MLLSLLAVQSTSSGSSQKTQSRNTSDRIEQLASLQDETRGRKGPFLLSSAPYRKFRIQVASRRRHAKYSDGVDGVSEAVKWGWKKERKTEGVASLTRRRQKGINGVGGQGRTQTAEFTLGRERRALCCRWIISPHLTAEI